MDTDLLWRTDSYLRDAVRYQLEFQDCAGNSESFLRASRPTAAEVVLDTRSLDYHETIMAAARAASGREPREDRQGTAWRIHRSCRGRSGEFWS